MNNDALAIVLLAAAVVMVTVGSWTTIALRHVREGREHPYLRATQFCAYWNVFVCLIALVPLLIFR